MLILQIALGIVLAVVILAYWPFLLGGAVLLAVGAVLVAVIGPDRLGVVAVIGFLAWCAWGVFKTLSDPNQRRSLVPSKYGVAYLVAVVLAVGLGLIAAKYDVSIAGYRPKDYVVEFMIAVAGIGGIVLPIVEERAKRLR